MKTILTSILFASAVLCIGGLLASIVTGNPVSGVVCLAGAGNCLRWAIAA